MALEKETETIGNLHFVRLCSVEKPWENGDLTN
jgi:hypothetical protein